MSNTQFIISPSQKFISPENLLMCDFLSREEKESALLNWKSTCEDLLRSTDEGMPGVGGENLSDVVSALIRLHE